ncbi:MULTISPECIES: autoinducer binding domain-containing protein [unclassified Rhizobium]|uniref:helix-turn-helix transcriptional regulator n=1 Tax=unclassified Rhizobium TaxID=2613769 RepID=UPI0006FB3117|nr:MULTISPECIES: autoinducer binding domain-containing protein [unclassified Rhizobium]KQV43736.1 LuxR family transcriptional regulator [Rhizobium sp. Root1212]KRD37920.1 LuxR family transcriptional regulator [Rhizobium sp. Root268]
MGDLSRDMTSLALPTGAQLPSELTREDDLREAFCQVMDAYGFDGYVVMNVPGKETRALSEVIVMTNWSKRFLRAYDSACIMQGSPVIERLRRSTVPFTYDARIDNCSRDDGKTTAATELFEREGLSRGLYIPVHDVNGHRGAIGFGGSRAPVTAQEMSELTFLAGYLFGRLCEIGSRRGRKAGLLSRREIECLNWAAAGKTTTEMARILDLSEYTVNHYLSRATRKLDSVNRVQTIAKALRAGLIN